MNQYERRFGGLGRLFGTASLELLQRAHVCVVGIGGVGSWTVEALARSGVGELTLVDLDDVCISNVNRQLHALNGELGKPKVEVMARRVESINPECRVHAMQAFFVPSTAEEILKPGVDVVVDAIDAPSLKCLLIACCKTKGIPIFVAGGAGGRRDPTAIQTADLAFSSHDRLLQEVRRRLRRDHAFPSGDRPFEVECVFSREPAVYPTAQGGVCAERPASADLRLDCNSGFGTASFVTGAFGLVLASRVVARIAAGLAPAHHRPLTALLTDEPTVST
jgi:tRNA A37 threonylcarbamoyladenosine dehydratase